MIFLTLGTHEPFDRLVRAVDAWCAATGRGAEVFGQITDHPGYEPKSFDWVATLPPEAYRARCQQAAFIVAHAGMGSIITAMTYRKPIVIMPRRADLGEQRNDHQRATAERFAPRPGVFLAEDEAALPGVLDRLTAAEASAPQATVGPFAEPRLTQALRQMIFAGRV